MKAKIYDFGKMIDSLLKYYKDNFTEQGKHKYKYNGPDLKDCRLTATNPTLKEHLSKEALDWDQEDQGREPIEVFIGCILQLGIQQGINIMQGEIDEKNDLVKKMIEALNQVIT